MPFEVTPKMRQIQKWWKETYWTNDSRASSLGDAMATTDSSSRALVGVGMGAGPGGSTLTHTVTGHWRAQYFHDIKEHMEPAFVAMWSLMELEWPGGDRREFFANPYFNVARVIWIPPEWGVDKEAVLARGERISDYEVSMVYRYRLPQMGQTSGEHLFTYEEKTKEEEWNGRMVKTWFPAISRTHTTHRSTEDIWQMVMNPEAGFLASVADVFGWELTGSES